MICCFDLLSWITFVKVHLGEAPPGVMILKVCGEGPIVPGFPNADIAIASGGSCTKWESVGGFCDSNHSVDGIS